jgi:hypothetical protein
VTKKALVEMFGVLRLTFGEIEVEPSNDECSGHSINRCHK